MLQMKTGNENIAYLEGWPRHYFEIADINQREDILRQVLAEHEDSTEDQRRLELLHKRFGTKKAKIRGDQFMDAWMSITIADQHSGGFFGKRAKERRLRKELRRLGIAPEEPVDAQLLAEWENFARVLLETCTGSKTYGATLFGMIPLPDKTVATKIATEIDLVTRIIPARYGAEAEVAPFRKVMVNAYVSSLENGQQYWDAYLAEKG